MTQIGSILHGIHIIDGGLATQLEALGARTSGPLWSAHVLEDEPEKVAAAHRAYIEAGAQILATCSYQVSRMGYAEVGLSAARADAALLRSIALARSVVAEFPARRVLVAGSLGPYGAALHNGGEYTGVYGCTHDDLVRFHRERIEVLAQAPVAAQPDLLAFETFPSLDEARAVGEALAPWPELPVWFSFSCRDEKHVSHGETLAETAALVASFPQTVAIGVNCVPARWLPSLITELKKGSSKPVMVYPNSGEGWDAANRCWTGSVTSPEEFGAQSAEWFRLGASIVGGCCRIGPAHIRAAAATAAHFFQL
ncbi:MAG: homocysteine S-methyltransferase [Terracidiphilus sp.]|nr:homocysteine S-methyltransferase [Terracidiphilus sp.]